MSDLNGKEIEILRTGTFRPMNGETVSFSAADLNEIATAYDSEAAPAPLVVGHPTDNAPAYGWVKSVRGDGDRLKATVHQVDPAFSDLIAAGRYRNRSVSVHARGSRHSPAPGRLYLEHVGFLGAVAPAVPGLRPVRLAGAGAVVITLPRDDSPAAADAQRLADLEAENHRLRLAARATEDRRFIADMSNQARFPAGAAADLLSFMGTLGDSVTLTFAAPTGEPTVGSQRDYFMKFLSTLPPLVTTGVFAPDMPEDELQALLRFRAAAPDERRTHEVDRIRQWVERQRAAGNAVSYADYPFNARQP